MGFDLSNLNITSGNSVPTTPVKKGGFDVRTTVEKNAAVNTAKAVAPKPDFWADNVVPMLTANPKSKLEEIYNYSNTPHIIQAMNGGYDDIIQKTSKTDPALSKKFSELKLASQNVVANMRVFNLTGDPAVLNAESDKANAAYSALYKSLSDNNTWRMTNEGKVLTIDAYDKQDQEAHEGPNHSNTARVVYNYGELQAAYESSGTSGEYEYLTKNNKTWSEMSYDMGHPIVKSWITTGIANINSKDTKKANSNSEAVELIADLINHTKDYSLDKSDKNFALSFAKLFNTYGAPEQMSMIKKNAERLNELGSNLGTHGVAKLYAKHRQSETNPNAIGNNANNFPSETGKTNLDYFNQQIELNTIYDEQNKAAITTKKFAGLAYENVKLNWKAVSNAGGVKIDKKDFDQAFDALVTKNGSIEGYTAWVNKLKKISSERNLSTATDRAIAYREETNALAMDQGVYFIGGRRAPINYTLLNRIADDNKTANWNDPLEYFGGDRNQEGEKEDLLAVYQALRTQYKKSYANVKMKDVHNQTLLKLNMGDSVNRSVVIPGLDLTVDKNYNVLSQTLPKQENVRNLLSLLKDDKGEIKVKDITVFDGNDINTGLHAKTKNEVAAYALSNPSKVQNFFKGNMTNVTMEFFRNTNVENTSAYSLYNKNTKKQILIFVPQSDLKKVKEKTYIATKKDIAETNFENEGFATMPVYDLEKYNSAQLTFDQDRDNYVGVVKYFNPKGDEVSYSHIIPGGHAVDLKSAKQNFNGFLKQFTPPN